MGALRWGWDRAAQGCPRVTSAGCPGCVPAPPWPCSCEMSPALSFPSDLTLRAGDEAGKGQAEPCRTGWH